MTRNILKFAAMTLPILAFALTPSTAMAQSYSGNWPLNVTQMQGIFRGDTFTFCLALTDNGSAGRTHSGPATLTGEGVGPGKLTGTFQVISGLLVVTIQSSSESGMDDGLMFVAPAADGDIGKGFFEDVADGEDGNSGVLTVGEKGGCN